MSGTRTPAAGSSAPTTTTPSRRGSCAWPTVRCNRPKLPGIPGIRDYQGHTFHTSRWDYRYTGGGTRRRPRPSRRQARGYHRDRRDCHPVCAVSRRSGQAPLRGAAHTEFRGRARQHAHRPGLGGGARRRLAEAPHGELQRPRVRGTPGRGSRRRRLDRSHRQDNREVPQGPGRRRGQRRRGDGVGQLREDGGDSCPGGRPGR